MTFIAKLGTEEQCIPCALLDAMSQEFIRREEVGLGGRFILPVESLNEEMCKQHFDELDRLQKRDGPNHWQPWNYIAGFAVSCNY